ncbi:NAD(P)-dependent glycerol-3-phosphate dehydrogenase, partial [bacterium]|nr:NAD(P)-dependent glycerol-3-phosphate dehydrogenase [bacterium]
CRPTAPWVLCSKGIEEETLLPMADVIESVWGPGSRDRLAVLSGPSFAAEVARGKPTTVCVASTNKTLGEYVQNLFMSNLFRVYTQDDMLGVELGGSMKNVMAIAAGVCDGLGLGDNARAALITRGLAEMTRLGTAMGARHETFSGLTGMGDLILTCCGPQSRNHTFGVLLARGKSPQEALDEIGMVVEGARTARSAKALAEKHGIEMPIVNEVYAVIYQNKKPEDAVRHLMEREAKPEWA